jgi:integrase
MRSCNYTLSPTRINNTKAKRKLFKLSDGGGLFIEVSPGGVKTWRYQYRFGGARKELTIGKYPEVGVADARDRHFECRAQLERGVDPAETKKRVQEERKQIVQESKKPVDDFEAFSKRWVKERLLTKSDTYRAQIESRLERFVWPEIGGKLLSAVRPADVLEIIEALRPTPQTAEGVRTIIQQVYNYAIQKLLVEVNPALPLRGVIQVPPAQHHRHLHETELGAFWRAVDRQGAHFVTIASTKMLVYSDATLNHFFKRLDFGVPDFSPHGTRGTGATLLREHGFGRDVVELLLAHTERNKTAAAYHHHELADERRRALQYLADQIDRLAIPPTAPDAAS